MNTYAPLGAPLYPSEVPQEDERASDSAVPPADTEAEERPAASVEALLEGSVADLRARLTGVDDESLLRLALEAESRVTGRQAIEARIAELAPAEEPSAETEEEPLTADEVLEPVRTGIRAGGYRIGPRGGWVLDRGD